MTILVVKRYRGFTVKAVRVGRKYVVEWTARDGTYFPLPKTTFPSAKDAWLRARELIDYQFAQEATLAFEAV